MRAPCYFISLSPYFHLGQFVGKPCHPPTVQETYRLQMNFSNFTFRPPPITINTPPGTSQATPILRIWGCGGGRNIAQGRGKRCVREMDRGHFVRGKSLCCWIDSIIITIPVILVVIILNLENYTNMMTLL